MPRYMTIDECYRSDEFAWVSFQVLLQNVFGSAPLVPVHINEIVCPAVRHACRGELRQQYETRRIVHPTELVIWKITLQFKPRSKPGIGPVILIAAAGHLPTRRLQWRRPG